MEEVKIYKCKTCGNVLLVLVDGEVTPVCCDEPMELLEAGSVDAAAEKHVPVISREGNSVEVMVGEVPHPMLEAHYITTIMVVQGPKYQITKLTPGMEPKAAFIVEDGPLTAYEYCNLHGLWKAEG